jgi:hypothetical protein
MSELRGSGQQTGSQKSAKPLISTGGWLATVCIAIIIAGVVGYLANLNKGFKIAIDNNGKVEVDVRADETFAQLLSKALEKNQREVEAILASRQYYNWPTPTW